jgi:hypothetical protein
MARLMSHVPAFARLRLFVLLLTAGLLGVAIMVATIAVLIVSANGVFGVMFGWLYWRYGLESAMTAHATTHVVNYLFATGPAIG